MGLGTKPHSPDKWGFTVKNLLTWKIKRIWTTLALAWALTACNPNTNESQYVDPYVYSNPDNGICSYNLEYQFDSGIQTLNISAQQINDSAYIALIEPKDGENIKIKASSLEELKNKIKEKAILNYEWYITYNTQNNAEQKTEEFIKVFSEFLEKEYPEIQERQEYIKSRKGQIEQEIKNLKNEKKQLEKEEKESHKPIKTKL